MAKLTLSPKPDKCEGCPFRGDGTGFVSDEVHEGAKLTILSARPSENDELQGKAYNGRSSKMIEGSLGKYGIGRQDVNWCYVTRCRGGHAGYEDAVRHCQAAYPLPPATDVIVPLDDESLKFAANLEEVETWRGSPIDAMDGYGRGKLVLPTPHPHFIFTKPRMRTASRSDFARIGRAVNIGTGIFRYDDTFHTAAEPGWFLELFGEYCKRDNTYIVLDVETSRHKPIDAEMKIFGFGWARNGAANINWDMLTEDQLDKLKEMVKGAKCSFVTATPFDYSVLYKYGFRFDWTRCHDLTLLHSRYDIELPHTVEFIASTWTYRKYWKNLSQSDPYYYNCLDNAGEWEAWDKLLSYCQREDPDVLRVYEKDRRSIRTAVRLHLTGMPLSAEIFKREKKIYKKERDVLEAELVSAFSADKPKMEEPPPCPIHKRYTGKTTLRMRKNETSICSSCSAIATFVKDSAPLNLRARTQMIGLLKAEGKVIPRKRRGGPESLDKGAIEKLAVQYNDPRMFRLLEFKKRDTVVVRYFKEAKTSPNTGRVHAIFSMHGAMHRWHATKPNQQQVKRPEDLVVVSEETGEERKEIHGPRCAYVPESGNVFLGFDGDGLHYRIAGCLSRDPFIIETLETYDKTGAVEHKPHIVNCAALFHVSREQAIEWMNHKASQYTFAKNFIYMLLNGGDTPALHLAAVTAGLLLDVPAVDKLKNNWLEQAHRFRDFRAALVAEAERTGKVTLDDGRRRRFYGLRWKEGKWQAGPDEIKEIYNLPLIGTEVSYVNPRVEKVLDFCERTAAWNLILYDHDGFMLEGPECEAVGVAKILMPLLDTPEDLGKGRILRVPWQPTMGKSWATMEPLDYQREERSAPVAVVA